MVASWIGISLLVGMSKPSVPPEQSGLELDCSPEVLANARDVVATATDETKFSLLVDQLGACPGGAPLRAFSALNSDVEFRGWIGAEERSGALQALCPGADPATFTRSDLEACRFDAVGVDQMAARRFWGATGPATQTRAALFVLARTLLWVALADGEEKDLLKPQLFLNGPGRAPLDVRAAGPAMEYDEDVLIELEYSVAVCYWSQYLDQVERPTFSLEVAYARVEDSTPYTLSAGPPELLACVASRSEAAPAFEATRTLKVTVSPR